MPSFIHLNRVAFKGIPSGMCADKERKKVSEREKFSPRGVDVAWAFT